MRPTAPLPSARAVGARLLVRLVGVCPKELAQGHKALLVLLGFPLAQVVDHVVDGARQLTRIAERLGIRDDTLDGDLVELRQLALRAAGPC